MGEHTQTRIKFEFIYKQFRLSNKSAKLVSM